MTIKPAEFEVLAVEIKSFGREFGFAESDASFKHVNVIIPVVDRHMHGIELGVVNVPEFDLA